MNVGRIFRCIAFVLSLGGVAGAGVMSVSQTLDYTDNGPWDVGPFFVVPGEILDHPPHYRNCDEDWGWFHDMNALVPADATGIESATIAIEAWDVYYTLYNDLNQIKANNVLLGHLPDTGGRNFLWAYFDLPADVLDELWTDGEVYIFMNIDVYRLGGRVTLRQAKLTVNYSIAGETPEPDPTVEVHRFWSKSMGSHFYTGSETERNKLIYSYPDVWAHEGVAYLALVDDSDVNASPVYRFWSKTLGGHFYTADPDEYNKLVNQYADVWTDEGVAFYAYAEESAPPETIPVYRFWSNRYDHHFYTSTETEKQKLIDNYPLDWTYEGIAWYAYPSDEE